MNTKLENLKEHIKSLESAVIAFSGGVDSAVLVAVAHEILHGKMVAVTGRSASVPTRDLEAAKSFCRKRNIPHLIINTEEFAIPEYVANPDNRCFYCKKELFLQLEIVCKDRGYKYVVEGTNASELTGHRPGYEAACKNPNVATPYVKVGITKDDVREIAKSLNLEVADKPPTACLSSRIPTGVKLDVQLLKNIDIAENFLISLGVKQVRIRHHGNIARLELDAESMQQCLKKKDEVTMTLSSLGWKYITLDLKGYREGGGR